MSKDENTNVKEEKQRELTDDFGDEDKVETAGNFHDFKEADTVIGILLRLEEGAYGEVPVLEIDGEEGKEEVSIGSYTALRGKLTDKDIGMKVKIIRTGEEKSKTGRNYFTFDVFKK